jgi:hypothetical protein
MPEFQRMLIRFFSSLFDGTFVLAPLEFLTDGNIVFIFKSYNTKLFKGRAKKESLRLRRSDLHIQNDQF